MSIAEKVGTEREDDFVVEGVLITDVGGLLETGVLSTPGMIGMMERNCALLVQEFLPEGSATVGFEVCVKHVSGAGEGAECRVWGRLDEVIDDRKFRFSVEVKEGDRTLGVGTHERRAISFNVAAG
jgi:Predicted thioesterase